MESNCMEIHSIIYDTILALVTGIAASYLTTLSVRKFEKQKAKNVLLNNNRFMENIEDSHMVARLFLINAKPILYYYNNVKWFHFPGYTYSEEKVSFWKDKKCQKDIQDFFKNNKNDIKMIIGNITFKKNDVLYETINKSLSISFNQNLCNISDNLKNRCHNFMDDESENNIDILLKSKNVPLLYYTLFDILAYISYLFDLYSFLGIEDSLNSKFDASLTSTNK